MDTPKGPGSESENLIAACATMLSYRRFATCRDFAFRIPRSDPDTSTSLDRILAIVDVLSAVGRRLPSNHPDYYSILQLRRDDAARNRDLVVRQFKKLALLLDPTAATKFPFSDEALTCVREAWHVLSDPQKRELYDREVGYRHPNGTFWTACPYCWNLFEYEERYEDFPLQCQSCGKAFHGVAVKPPVKEEQQEREYYWCHASVPLRYRDKDDNNMMMGEQTQFAQTQFEQTPFVYISDDDDDDDDGVAVAVAGGEGLRKNVGEGVWGDVRNQGCERVVHGNEAVDLQGNGKRRMRMKTVAKRAIGNRMRSRQGGFGVDGDLDLDLDGDDDGELEFTEGDGDVFIGVRFDN